MEKNAGIKSTKLENVNIELATLLTWWNQYGRVDYPDERFENNEEVNKICNYWWKLEKLKFEGSKMFMNIRSVEDIKKFKLNIVELIKSQVNNFKFNVDWSIEEGKKLEEKHKEAEEDNNIFEQGVIDIDNNDY